MRVRVIAEPGRYFAETAATLLTPIYGHRDRAGPEGEVRLLAPFFFFFGGGHGHSFAAAFRERQPWGESQLAAPQAFCQNWQPVLPGVAEASADPRLACRRSRRSTGSRMACTAHSTASSMMLVRAAAAAPAPLPPRYGAGHHAALLLLTKGRHQCFFSVRFRDFAIYGGLWWLFRAISGCGWLLGPRGPNFACLHGHGLIAARPSHGHHAIACLAAASGSLGGTSCSSGPIRSLAASETMASGGSLASPAKCLVLEAAPVNLSARRTRLVAA
jgi:hypothetical protein